MATPTGISIRSEKTKPAWLKKKIHLSSLGQTKSLLRDLKLETVCEQALCPNIGECFSKKQATFLILGRNCTRSCLFCNVEKGFPSAVDAQEPERVSLAVKALELRHVVITSVTRDDLADGGAEAFAQTAREIRKRTPSVRIEVLIPDFKLSADSLVCVARAGCDIIAHNVETVPSLYPAVRNGSDYKRSLAVLEKIKLISPQVKTKSGIMLGLGEKEEEVLAVFSDLAAVSCDFLSIGQYLAPSTKHYPVAEFIHPDRFDFYKDKALAFGFKHVASSPYVRSSYLAQEYLLAK
jgi:lipoyl synthase